MIMNVVGAYSTYSSSADDAAAITMFLILALFWMLVFGAIGAAIGSTKGSAVTGLFLGALLGVIGIIILLVMKPRTPAVGVPPTGAVGPASATVVGWHPDPFQRYQLRYYDGTRWTGHVSTNGAGAIDEPPADSAGFVGPPTPTSAYVPPVYDIPGSSTLSAAPSLGPATRKWDKNNKQWLVRNAAGEWTPERGS